MYDNIKEFRKEIVSWIAFIAMILSGIEWYLMPKIERLIDKQTSTMESVARAESNRAFYVIYSEFSEAYGAIPDKKPHQSAKLEHMKNKRDYYQNLMVVDHGK